VGSESRDDWEGHWRDYNEAASNNPAQEYRRQVIFELLGLRGSGAGVRLLDIGSGQGDLAAAIRAKFPLAEILGLELSGLGVEISKRRVPDVQFVQRNLLMEETVPTEHCNWATHAICSEVIEHVDDPVRLLRSAREYLRPDCVLALTAPGGPMSEFDKHIGHRTHYRPKEIERLLKEAGYAPEYVVRAGFPFFNLYRCVVILRGKQLVDDVSEQRNPSGSRLAAAVMAVFHLLFRMNVYSSPWGWQMIAKAKSLPHSTRVTDEL
jgi:trans-aconitate methyltransferase